MIDQGERRRSLDSALCPIDDEFANLEVSDRNLVEPQAANAAVPECECANGQPSDRECANRAVQGYDGAVMSFVEYLYELAR